MRRIRSVMGRAVAAVTVSVLSVLTPTLASATVASSPGSLPASPHYSLIDLTRHAPAGYNTPIPVAINKSGTVVGVVFSGGHPSLPVPVRLKGLSPAKLQKALAGTTAVPHVFVFAKGTFTVVPTPASVAQAYVTGIDDAGSFSVVRCDSGNKCNHYYAVTQVASTGKAKFLWLPLQAANIGLAGLGPMAGNGDVAGAIANPRWPVAVVWHLRKDGTYSLPVTLGRDPRAGTFARAYIPLAVSSATGHDVMGGNEDTPSYYPDASPALWGPKFAHDYGWIGSVTTAMTGDGTSNLATVGCFQPVPVCGPSCPINAQVDTVTVVKGLPAVTAIMKLDNPSASVPHCGVAPLGITVDPQGHPFTVGLMATVGHTTYLPEAVIWAGRRIESLNGLVNAPPHTDLQWALGVNSAGQIIGTGTIRGVKHSAFLLTPTGSW
jgi:hypothetical protein